MLNVCEEDLETFRNVPGLLQKYYSVEKFYGAISGFYIFETKRELAKYSGLQNWACKNSQPGRYSATDTFMIKEGKINRQTFTGELKSIN